MTTETAAAATPDTPRYGEVGRLVDRRVRTLLERDASSTARAQLAHLRAGIGREPGTDPRTWSLTVADVPGTPTGDAPTPQERAVHVAMTLFALHQQSRSEPMHRQHVGLGLAVARLERARGGADGDVTSPVRRRFDAVVTATDVAEVAHHLRGLVTQMRGAGVSLDYGRLADDLHTFQRFPDDVRRRWARQLYQPDRSPSETTVESTETTEETP